MMMMCQELKKKEGVQKKGILSSYFYFVCIGLSTRYKKNTKINHPLYYVFCVMGYIVIAPYP